MVRVRVRNTFLVAPLVGETVNVDWPVEGLKGALIHDQYNPPSFKFLLSKAFISAVVFVCHPFIYNPTSAC